MTDDTAAEAPPPNRTAAWYLCTLCRLWSRIHTITWVEL